MKRFIRFMKNISVNNTESASDSRNATVSFKKKRFLIVCCVLLLAIISSVTLAILIKQASPVKNNFSLLKLHNEINEEFDGENKEKVEIKNIGEVEEFVRVAVVVNWKDEDGNVNAVAPVSGTDYTVSYNTTDWQKAGKYWYYKKSVKPGESTSNLLGSTPVTVTDAGKLNAPDGYTLSFEVIEEAIQSSPSDAMQEAWNLTSSDGAIVF